MPESDSLERRLRALADRPDREGGTGGLDGGQVLYAARRHHRRRTALTAAGLVAAVAIGVPLGTRLLGPVTAGKPAIPAASSGAPTIGSTPSATYPSTSTPTPSSSASGRAAGELFAHSTVLARPGKAPVLCLGAVAQSLPPQCDGPSIVGWDWATAPAEASSLNGTRWVDAYVVGTYDGTRFTLTRPPISPAAWTGPAPAAPPIDPTTPCSAPAGGWQVLDPARTTTATLEQAFTTAQKQPGFAGLRVDPASVGPTAAPGMTLSGGPSEAPQSPQSTILTVWVAGDAATAERAIRAVWGGMLCVATAPRSDQELQALMNRVSGRFAELGMLSMDRNVATGVVRVVVIYDDGSLQGRLDVDYGPGRVTVSSALKPMPAKAS